MKTLLSILFLIIFAACNNSNTAVEFKLIPVQSGQYWGYINHDGKFVINPQFAVAAPFYEGLALIRSTDNKYGFINEEGKFVVNPIYKEATNFNNGLALVVKENSKLEFINTKGETKLVLAPSFERAANFREGLARVNIDGKGIGYINRDGKIVIPAIYTNADDFSEGLAEVGKYDSSNHEVLYGYINKKGELTIPFQFKSASKFKNGLASVSNGSQNGYINKDGKYVINPQFENASIFDGNFAVFRQGELYGYIDKTGKTVINPQFKSGDLFYDNKMASVISTEGKVGFIDEEGKYIINPQFDFASRFYGDFAIIKMGNKFGAINKSGKIIINPQFDQFYLGSEYNSIIESDYFDLNDVVLYIVESLTDNSINGFSAATTFKTLKTLYPNINENNYYSFGNFKAKENKNISLEEISTSFNGGLVTYTPVYAAQQVYDPVSGGYTTQQVVTGNNATINWNANLSEIRLDFNLRGKAYTNKTSIVKALYDKFNTNGFVDGGNSGRSPGVPPPPSFGYASFKKNNFIININSTANNKISLTAFFNYSSRIDK